MTSFRSTKEAAAPTWALLRKLTSVSGRKYLTTIFCQVLMLAAGIVTMRIAVRTLGVTGFGEYQVARRGTMIIGFTLLLAMGTGVARYVSLAGRLRSGRSPLAYLLAALGLSLVTSAIFAAFVFSAPEFVGTLLFGRPVSRGMLWGIVAAVVGNSLQTIGDAFYRGQLKIYTSNALVTLCGAVVLPIAVLTSGGSASVLMMTFGLGASLTSLAFLIYGLRGYGWNDLDSAKPLAACKDLAIYGVPRAAGEFAWFGLYSVPTIIVAHRGGLERAGYFSFSISLMQMVTSCFTSIGLVLLPHFGKMISEGRRKEMVEHIQHMLWACVLITLILVIGTQLVIGRAIPWYMGAQFADAVPLSRWLLCGSIPIVIYVLLRQPLDAAAVWPHNTINLCLALAVSTLLLTFPGSARWDGASMCASFVVLAGLSVRSWRRTCAFPTDIAAGGAPGAAAALAAVDNSSA